MPKINVGEFCVFYFWRGRCCIKVERSSFKRSSALSCWIFLVSLCQILPLRDLSTPVRLWNIFSLWLTHKNDSVASLLPSKHPPDASEQPLRQMKYEGRSGSAAVSPNSYTTASMLILLDGRRELNCFLKSLHEKCNGTRAYFHYPLLISVYQQYQSFLSCLLGDYSCFILIREKPPCKRLFLKVHKVPKEIQSSWKGTVIKVNTLTSFLSAAENSENPKRKRWLKLSSRNNNGQCPFEHLISCSKYKAWKAAFFRHQNRLPWGLTLDC